MCGFFVHRNHATSLYMFTVPYTCTIKSGQNWIFEKNIYLNNKYAVQIVFFRLIIMD